MVEKIGGEARVLREYRSARMADRVHAIYALEDDNENAVFDAELISGISSEPPWYDWEIKATVVGGGELREENNGKFVLRFPHDSYTAQQLLNGKAREFEVLGIKVRLVDKERV